MKKQYGIDTEKNELPDKEVLQYCKYLFLEDPTVNPNAGPKILAWKKIVEEVVKLCTTKHQPMDETAAAKHIKDNTCPTAKNKPMPSIDHDRIGHFLEIWGVGGKCSKAAPTWLAEAVRKLNWYTWVGRDRITMRGCK